MVSLIPSAVDEFPKYRTERGVIHGFTTTAAAATTAATATTTAATATSSDQQPSKIFTSFYFIV